MEKLHSDMLEMILSQPIKRLNERQTKFLIYQVNLCFSFPLDYEKEKMSKLVFLLLGFSCVEIFA